MDLTLVDQLLDLGIRRESRSGRAIVRAAELGCISDRRCAMGLGPEETGPGCLCPTQLGGREYFEPIPRLEWIPSVDRYPILGKNGGTYVPNNVRLAHRLCNYVGYADPYKIPYAKLSAKVAATTAATELQRVEATIRRLEERRHWLLKVRDPR